MRRPIRSRRLGCLSCCAGVLAALALALPAAAPAAGTAAPGREPLVTPGEATAEIRFPTAMRHAVVLQEPGKVRRLHAGGDVIFHPQEPARSLTVERVTAGALILRDGPRGRQYSVPAGNPIPGFAGLLFTGTVMLEEVHYRYRPVERVAHQDPVLVSFEGSRAILEVEVVRSPAPGMEDPITGAAPPGPQPAHPPRAKLDAGVLGQVRVTEVGSGIYDVNADDVHTVLENTGRVLADLSPIILPIISARSGLQYRITSAASDGVISSQGYTVLAPKLAERAGIKVGDTILSINGRPVDGFGSLYRIYREVGRDSALTTVRMELERQGTRLTKTYRIR
jgi:hypothetical protein